MRTVLAGEVAQAQSYDSDYFVRVEVQNADGTWIDVGAALGKNWITNASWSEHRDTPVSSATFTFIQQIGSDSLAPLMASSALNVDDAAAYAPLLEVGRLVRASTATMPHGTALDTGKYREIFTGRIDNVSGVDNPNSWVGPITITCSDSGAWLMGLQVEKAGTEYGTDAGVALETVVQNDINDNIPAGEPAVTLHKQSSSSYNVTTWKQDEGSLLNSLITLVGDSTGEDIRYRYDTDHVSKLTWFNPDRNRVTVDASFTDTSSFIISLLERDFKNIRNAGELTYTDSTTGLTGKVTSVDTTSNGLYRRQFFRLPSSKMVGNGTDAQAVIDAVVHDLAFPPADATITLPYCWFVQLYDRYTFSANNRQFSDDQTFAVVGFEHTIESGKGQTVLTASARVIGAYARWIRQISQTEAPEIRIANFREVSRTATDVNFGWSPTGIIHEQWLYLSTPAQPVGSDPWAALVGSPAARLTPSTNSYTVPIPAAGSVTYGRLVPIDSNAKNGRAWEFTVQGASVTLIQRASIVSTSATQMVVRVAVANPVAGGTVTIAYGAGGLTVTPATGQTIAGGSVTTDIDTTGYVDFTITRPAFGTGTGRVTFTASCAGRVSDTDSADIPAVEKTSFGPNLVVTPTPGATSYSIAYSGDAVTLSIDGAAYGAPSASPITVTRNAYNGADKVYVFKGLLDSQTITNTVVVPAQARDLSVNKLTASEITVSSLSAIAAELGSVKVTDGTSDLTFYRSTTLVGQVQGTLDPVGTAGVALIAHDSSGAFTHSISLSCENIGGTRLSNTYIGDATANSSTKIFGSLQVTGQLGFYGTTPVK